jgi:HNH endonuclease
MAGITFKTRYRIITRDHSKCRRCGATVADGARLVVDHIIPRDWGGSNEDTNLWTLCEQCNLGKQAWQSDIDAATMATILKEPSGRSRLRRFFELRVGQMVTKEELQIVAGITDYARRIRELRQEDHLNILSHYEDAQLKPGQYRYIPQREL